MTARRPTASKAQIERAIAAAKASGHEVAKITVSGGECHIHLKGGDAVPPATMDEVSWRDP